MKLTGLSIAFLAALLWLVPAVADGSIADRLAKMEQRIRYLEERVAAQDQCIVEMDRKIAALSGREDAWFKQLEIGGAVELEAIYNSPYKSNNTTEVYMAEAELVIAAAIHDWVGGEVIVANDDDGKLEFDTATLTIGPPDGSLSLTVGQQGLPFGVFESNMISDPLTNEIGEAGGTSLVLGLSSDRFHWSLFAFDGDNQPGGEQRIKSLGVALGYAMEAGGNRARAWTSHISTTSAIRTASRTPLPKAWEKIGSMPTTCRAGAAAPGCATARSRSSASI